eukprot:278188_1
MEKTTKGILKNRATPVAPDLPHTPTFDVDSSLKCAAENSKRNKQRSSIDADGSLMAGVERSEQIRWDEKNLEMNEAEKVPRMKIDEPPTPYYGSAVEPEDDDIEMDPSFLDSLSQTDRRGSSSSVDMNRERNTGLRLHGNRPDQLVDEAMTRRNVTDEWDMSGSDIDEHMSSAQAKKHHAFEMQRSHHYDEFRRVKAMREQMAAEMDADIDAADN